MKTCKCYTFYSYKGGSGRSTTLVNTLPHLIKELKADSEHPILVVDADLESAGITYFFESTRKFSNQFIEAINTTKLILRGNEDDYLEGAQANIIFGARGDAGVDLIKKELEEREKEAYAESFRLLCKDETYFDKITADIFKGVQLTNEKWGMLKTVIEKIVEYENDSEEGETSEYFKKEFDIINVIASLLDVEEGFLSEKEKADEKQSILNGFLPTETLVDISDYFDVPKNTVRFLGVDVVSRETDAVFTGADDKKQEVGNGALNRVSKGTIRALIDTCEERGYRAVIFDSAAGTQSTAHVLQEVSDVLVYCMRPTRQFYQGTEQQLRKYEKELQASCANSGKKKVILLPTAVELGGDDEAKILRENALARIRALYALYPDFVDVSFCKVGTCLNNVGVFKWHEMILGSSNACKKADDDETESIVQRYKNSETMSDDAKTAYKVFSNLAKKIIENSTIEEKCED